MPVSDSPGNTGKDPDHRNATPAGFEASNVCFMQTAVQLTKAQGSLDITPELARQLIACSFDCIKVLNLDGRILYMSPGGQELLDIDSPAQWLNKPWVDFWRGTENQSAQAAVETARSGGMGRFEGYAATLKGTPKWWDIVVTPLRNAAGQIERLLAISRDITERKQSNQELRRQEILIRELSTPVLSVEEGLLIVPLIGTVDPDRAQQLTEQLLKAIRANRAQAVVIDVTGVPAIDTSAANNLILTAEAARLLGATVILTGISREIALTLVTLGVQFGNLRTAGDLRSGMEQARSALARG